MISYLSIQYARGTFRLTLTVLLSARGETVTSLTAPYTAIVADVAVCLSASRLRHYGKPLRTYRVSK